MKRIGRAASHMAKGNLVLYNFYVVLIASLFSFFIFLVAGSTVLFAVFIISYVGREIMGSQKDYWSTTIMICMVTLTVSIGFFNLLAIAKNIKLGKSKKSI